MTDKEHLGRILALAQTRPFTLEHLHSVTGEFVAWKGAGYEVPSNIYIGPVKVDVVKKLVEALISQMSKS